MPTEHPQARPRCGATTRAGTACRTDKLLAGGRCRLHGGASPVGIASPHFTTGRWSRAVPALAARYAAAEADPSYLALKSEIALIDTRLGMVLERADAGDHAGLWQTVLGRWEAYRAARGTEREGAAYERLDATIRRGGDAWRAWDAVRELVHDRRRLVAGEVKRIRVAQTHLSAQEAMALVTRTAEVIKRHVDDDDTLRAIARELDVVLRRPPDRAR